MSIWNESHIQHKHRGVYNRVRGMGNILRRVRGEEDWWRQRQYERWCSCIYVVNVIWSTNRLVIRAQINRNGIGQALPLESYIIIVLYSTFYLYSVCVCVCVCVNVHASYHISNRKLNWIRERGREGDVLAYLMCWPLSLIAKHVHIKFH